ncbi:hypothetical protein ATANTOWER_006692 [Ataeniobius toweri]|uniref:Uncharacterized protein n=1 Tax=Ataeniobius toweri TaxID=208326 RepID=A0ABU7C0D1_9TELE|nr:hypothetical protein [Ataeniobius toweri]
MTHVSLTERTLTDGTYCALLSDQVGLIFSNRAQNDSQPPVPERDSHHLDSTCGSDSSTSGLSQKCRACQETR